MNRADFNFYKKAKSLKANTFLQLKLYIRKMNRADFNF
jgi:hypothetical protein